METLKVLFVCSGNKKQGISPIVLNQGDAIQKLGVEVDYFPINGNGLKGYLKNYSALRKKIKAGNYTAIHAHYSFCGMLVSMAAPFNRNIVVSLMGAFYDRFIKYFLIHLFYHISWKAVIVKSPKMKQEIRLKKAVLIPNGVSLEKYDLLSKREAFRKELGFDSDRKYVIFVSDPSRAEKNFSLCEKAVIALNDTSVILVPVFNLMPEEVIKYQIAADVLMLTSTSEGSPNVIKEAMAACCPLVTTNVGDVATIIGDTPGCFILNTFDLDEAVLALRNALNFNARTNGRERIISLGLDANTISQKILDIYLQ
jgi:teichuronic acid biosynthesis glycosyltransferase TuaC